MTTRNIHLNYIIISKTFAHSLITHTIYVSQSDENTESSKNFQRDINHSLLGTIVTRNRVRKKYIEKNINIKTAKRQTILICYS